MCMGGGGGSRATIYQPNTGQYDSMLAMQQQAMQSSMNNGMMQSQQALQAAIRSQNQALSKIADAKTKQAADAAAVNQEALRMSQMMGPPPPEETAKAPSVGDRDRYGRGAEGKKALRIRRRPKSSAKGVGLTIN